MQRDKVIRIGAIVIVLALLLSLLAGAFSITPSQAAEPPGSPNSVQNNLDPQKTQDLPVFELAAAIDTDGDGIPNNEDPDIDGDGVVNANDGDIDGDGISNFDDGDPAATNGFDGKTPNKPGTVTFENLTQNGSIIGVAISVVLILAVGILIWRKSQQKPGKKAGKNI